MIHPLAEDQQDSAPEGMKGDLEEAIGETGATLEILTERLGWPLSRLLVKVGRTGVGGTGRQRGRRHPTEAMSLPASSRCE